MAPGVKKHSAVASPDGGWGWMIVAGCFITTICTRAVTRCVSIFFLEFHMHFSSDYSRTAWIHSLVDCTTMLCAPLGSYIGNRLSCRVAVMVGGLLSSLGLILSSFASSLEYLYLSLGILTGMGFALCYTPVVAMVGTYFSQRKALAYGIAMSGSGIGTFVLAPVVQLLIELYSWRGALLILGGFVSHLCVCGALMRPLGSQSQKQDDMDQEEEHCMLNSKLAGAKLHMELSLEERMAVKENLEMGELDFSVGNIDKVSNDVLEEEIPQNEDQEQAQCLLRNEEQVELAETTDSNKTDGWSVASNQQGSTLEEKLCGEKAEEYLVVTYTDIMNNPVNTELNPGDTNCKPINSKGPPASDQKSKLDTNVFTIVPAEWMQADSERTNSKPHGSMLVHSALPDLMQTDSEMTGSNFHKTMLIDSAQNDSIQVNSEIIDSGRAGSELSESKTMLNDTIQADLKLPESLFIHSAQRNLVLDNSELTGLMQFEPMQGNSELNDLKLSEPMLVYSVLNDSLPAKSVHADSKLADSKLFYEVALCEQPGFHTKIEAPLESEEKAGCFFLPSTEEYGFLLLPDFLLLSVSFLFLAFGCSVPFVYLVPYSLSIGVGHQQAAFLMSVLGVMGIVGNITFGWISDRRCLRAYRIVSYLFAVGLEGLSCLFVPMLCNFSLLVPFSLFYGYFDGAYVALLPVVTSDAVGPAYLSSALGVVCFLHAIPYLMSPPIAGWLVDQTGSYTTAFLLCGFSLICSALILATFTLARHCSRRSSHPY